MNRHFLHKRYRLLGTIGLVFGFSGAIAPAPLRAEVPLTRADVESVYNAVEFIPNGDDARPATIDDWLAVGDAIRTAEQARAELRFNDGSLARVGERATFWFIPNTRDFRLSNGTALFLIPPDQGPSNIQTPSAITGIQGTALVVRHIPYECDASDLQSSLSWQECPGRTVVMVLTESPKGPVEVTTPDGHSEALAAGNMAVIEGNSIQVLEFNLELFYDTSPLVEGLDLNNPDFEGTGSPTDPVRQETWTGIESQRGFQGGYLLNPDVVSMTTQFSVSTSWLLPADASESTFSTSLMAGNNTTSFSDVSSQLNQGETVANTMSSRVGNTMASAGMGVADLPAGIIRPHSSNRAPLSSSSSASVAVNASSTVSTSGPSSTATTATSATVNVSVSSTSMSSVASRPAEKPVVASSTLVSQQTSPPTQTPAATESKPVAAQTDASTSSTATSVANGNQTEAQNERPETPVSEAQTVANPQAVGQVETTETFTPAETVRPTPSAGPSSKPVVASEQSAANPTISAPSAEVNDELNKPAITPAAQTPPSTEQPAAFNPSGEPAPTEATPSSVEPPVTVPTSHITSPIETPAEQPATIPTMELTVEEPVATPTITPPAVENPVTAPAIEETPVITLPVAEPVTPPVVENPITAPAIEETPTVPTVTLPAEELATEPVTPPVGIDDPILAPVEPAVDFDPAGPYAPTMEGLTPDVAGPTDSIFDLPGEVAPLEDLDFAPAPEPDSFQEVASPLTDIEIEPPISEITPEPNEPILSDDIGVPAGVVLPEDGATSSDDSSVAPSEVVAPESIPEVVGPEVVEPEVIEPEVAPEVVVPEVVEPEVAPEVVEPEVMPEMVAPEVVAPEVVEPEVVGPEMMPEVIEPEVAPEVVEPEVMPEVIEPEVAPEVVAPEVVGPEMTPDVVGPEVAPEVVAPEVTPDVVEPDVTPEVVEPEIQPEVTEPEVIAPEVVPDVIDPEVAPETVVPDVSSDIESQPETGE